ncbi:MAG: hypothetical protein IPM13_11120 [Phycisphaerales bacterium]|nr:hypothetical protein [Phycisphaerales bacterium]
MLATSLVTFLVLFQAAQPAPAPPAQPAPPPAAEQPTEAPPPPPPPAYDTGPMRAEIVAMREIRLKYMDSDEKSNAESNFAMQVRVAGDKLARIKRFGNLILSDVADDTGKAMITSDTYSEQERTTMRPQMMPPERLRDTGLLIATRGLVSARGAREIARLRGSVKLVLADATDRITILNPAQFSGQSIEDVRLKEMGIELKVLTADDIEQPMQAQRCMLIQVVSKADNIQSFAFFDGSLSPIRHRENPVTTKSGASAMMYCFDGGQFTDETILVLEVHPQVEVLELPVVADHVALP